jgi:hypothetical protein
MKHAMELSPVSHRAMVARDSEGFRDASGQLFAVEKRSARSIGLECANDAVGELAADVGDQVGQRRSVRFAAKSAAADEEVRQLSVNLR